MNYNTSDSGSTTPRVTIVIPTYNYAHYIAETIESALNQTFNAFNLVVVDNASTDNTEEVVAQYLGDPRVSYRKNERNLGLVGNWNRGLSYVTGDYVKFLCADDRLHERMLEIYVPIMDSDESISLITCDKQAFGSKTHETITPVTHKQPGWKAVLQQLENNYCWIGEPTSVMFRKRDLKVGEFSPKFRQYVDWEYWIRLLSIGDCYVVPEKLAYVRFHPGTNSRELKKKRFVLCFEEYRLCKDVQLGKYNINTKGSNIDNAVRDRAASCVKIAMLKTIPALYKKENWRAFWKAFAIAVEEKLFFRTIYEMLGGLKRKTLRQFTN